MSDEKSSEVELILANDTAVFLDEHVENPRVLNRIEKYLRALSAFPEMGQEYSPAYEASRPPIPCRWIAIPSTPFTIYYHFFEEAKRIVVLYVEDQRASPNKRFSQSE